MEQIKDLGTTGAMRCLLVHLGVLFIVIFPVGILVLTVTKYLIQFLFWAFGDASGWIFSQGEEVSLATRAEACTLENCTAGFVVLFVFMVRALLKMGELPSSTDGIIALHVRLGLWVTALPLLTVCICTITSLAIFLVFSGVDSFVDTYHFVSLVVFLPAVIGTWIWVWRGTWITSLRASLA